MATLCCPPFDCGVLDFCCTLPVASSCSSDEGGAARPHRNPFRESLKSLEADIMHANTLLSGEMLRDSEGATLQLRLGFSPLAPLLLFLVQWADCSLAGALGLLRVLIYKVYRNGHSTANVYERKATVMQFSRQLYPALQQVYPGLSEAEFREQQRQCRERYLAPGGRAKGYIGCACSASRAGSSDIGGGMSSIAFPLGDHNAVRGGPGGLALGRLQSPRSLSSSTLGALSSSSSLRLEAPNNLSLSRLSLGGCGGGCAASVDWRGCFSDLASVEEEGGHRGCSTACRVERERERECGICLEERRTQVVLPTCGHCMCQKCFKDWNSRDQSCPFCRRGLTRIDSGDLWEMVESADVQDMGRITRDNIRRLFIFVHRLPVVFADSLMDLTPSERRPLM